MNQPPAAVNGAPTANGPTQSKKSTAASALFKPTNNQKKRFPLNAPLKPPPRPPQAPNGNNKPDLKSVTTFFNAHTQSAQPTATATLPAQQNLPVKEYKVVTTKRELLDGLRYHLLQLDDKVSIDIRNEDDFPKPARLHRRNPDWKTPAKDADGTQEADAESEAMAKRREARQKEREANLAQIAPSANSRRRNMFSNKKSAQVYHNAYTDEEKRRIQMNYEEKLPWVLEDFDSKHVLIGKHNQGSMGVYAGFVCEPSTDGNDTKLRLIPIEKAYRFDRPSNLQENVDFEAIEKAFRVKKNFDPEILLRKKEERRNDAAREQLEKKSKGLFVLDRGLANTRENEDGDLDFEDDFADDEEGDLFGVDEDAKVAEKKVKEDHLKANIGWQEKDENEVDAREEKEDEQERLKQYWGSAMRTKLEKRERNYNLGSDSDGDDSVSQADLTSSH
jgi:transcription initiation factor TFIIF subunit alpha